MSEIRILAVDDYAPFQRFISEMFAQQKDLKVIAMASNGWEALQIAKELRPDVILMDVSLPEMNGIEATQRIREVSPESRILFLSEHMGRDIVDEAFAAGGMGYVLKSDLLHDLIPGVRAILRGERFLSRSLRDAPGTRSSPD